MSTDCWASSFAGLASRGGLGDGVVTGSLSSAFAVGECPWPSAHGSWHRGCAVCIQRAHPSVALPWLRLISAPCPPPNCSPHRTPLILHLGCVAHQSAKWQAPPEQWVANPHSVSVSVHGEALGRLQGWGCPAPMRIMDVQPQPCCLCTAFTGLLSPAAVSTRRHLTCLPLTPHPPAPASFPPPAGSASQIPFQRYSIAAEDGSPVFVDPSLFGLAIRLPLKDCLAQSIG